jgi:Flp pilus assembly protein CpaB
MVRVRDVAAVVRRWFLRHRRLVVAALASLIAYSLVHVLAPPPPPTAPVVVAARDLSSGTRLAAGDLRLSAVDPVDVPDGAATQIAAVVGEVLAAPMRAGESLTDRRVLGAALVAGYRGDMVAAPVRIQDADVVALLHVGDRIDVYASNGDQTLPARQVVTDAPIVALPSMADTGREGGLVVLAVSEGAAASLAQASASTHLSVSLRQ